MCMVIRFQLDGHMLDALMLEVMLNLSQQGFAVADRQTFVDHRVAGKGGETACNRPDMKVMDLVDAVCLLNDGDDFFHIDTRRRSFHKNMNGILRYEIAAA